MSNVVPSCRMNYHYQLSIFENQNQTSFRITSIILLNVGKSCGEISVHGNLRHLLFFL